MTGILRFVLPMVFAAIPQTTTYQLPNYEFGSGGGSTGTTTYSVQGVSGQQSGADSSTTTYTAKTGLIPTEMANVPGAPTFTNPSSWYNKLHIVLNTANNPTDATFAIAISTDNFTTTRYIQSDNTVGNALGLEDYQTYATWGGASGFDVIGLTPNTSYSIKVKAMRGVFTESGYGPTASVSTSNVSLTFDIDVSASDTETAAPYTVSFGNLLASTVNDSPSKVWFDLDTNALSGGKIYILSQNSGLLSARTGYTIASVSGDLTSLNEGIGAQGSSSTQSGGGPFVIVNPYDGSTNNVGLIDAQYRAMFSSAAAITAGRSSFLLKAKTTTLTPAATDYADLFTVVAAPAF
jgi:hypothetical protein